MKRVLLALALVCAVALHAQADRISVTGPTDGVALKVKSTAQIYSINNPTEGLLMGNSTTKSLWYYDGTQWTDTGFDLATALLLSGNQTSTGVKSFEYIQVGGTTPGFWGLAYDSAGNGGLSFGFNGTDGYFGTNLRYTMRTDGTAVAGTDIINKTALDLALAGIGGGGVTSGALTGEITKPDGSSETNLDATAISNQTLDTPQNGDRFLFWDLADGGALKKVGFETLVTLFGGSGGTPTTDASDLTTGTLVDARLSTNVPLKNATNTYAGVNNYNNLLAIHGAGQLNLSPTIGFDWILDNTALYKGANPADFVDDEDLFLQRIVNSGDTPQFVFDADGDATIDPHVLNKGTADGLYAPIGSSGLNNDAFTGQELTDGYSITASDFATGRKVLYYGGPTNIEINLATDVASIGQKLILWQYGAGKIQVNKNDALNGISFATTDSINPVTLTKQFETFGYRPIGNWESYAPVTSAIAALDFEYDFNAESLSLGALSSWPNDGSGVCVEAVQGTAANQPTVVDQSGKKAVVFDGVNDILNLDSYTDLTALVPGTSNFTIIVVLGDDSRSTGSIIGDRDASDRSVNIGMTSSTAMLVQIGSSGQDFDAVPGTGDVIYSTIITGSTNDSYNVTTQLKDNSTTAIGGADGNNSWHIGARSSGTYFNGSVKRLLIKLSAITEAQLFDVISEIQTVNQ